MRRLTQPFHLALLSLVVCLSALPALAQDNLRFGVRLGVTSSALTTDAVTEAGYEVGHETGFGAAALVEVDFANRLAATAEASFDRRRYSHSFQLAFIPPGGNQIAAEQFTLATTLDFASLGVTGRWLPFGPLPYAPFIVAGPRLDVLLSSEGGRDYTPEGLPEEFPPYFEDTYPAYFANLSLSGVFGLGVATTPEGWPELRAEVRYGRTVTDILADLPEAGTVSGVDLTFGIVW
jgi:hypothetical protein